MILQALLIILILLGGLALLLLLSPWVCRVDGGLQEGESQGEIQICLVSPLLASLTVCLPAGEKRLKLLGVGLQRRPPAKRKGPSEEPPQEPPAEIPEVYRAPESAARDLSAEPEDTTTAPLEEPPPAEETVSRSERPAAEEPNRRESAEKEQSRSQPPPPESAQGERRKKKGGLAELYRKLRQNKALFLLRQTGLQARVLRWLLRILKSFRLFVTIERLAVQVRACSDDPVSLGWIYGTVNAIRHALLLDDRKGFFVECLPVFDRPGLLEVQGHLRLRTSLARIFFPLLVAIATFPYWTVIRVWWKMRTLRKAGKQPASAGSPDVAGSSS